MKKTLIAIITAIYIFAIVIVAFLGSRAEVTNKTVYVDNIALLNEDVMNINTGKKAIEVFSRPSEEDIDEEGKGVIDKIYWNYGTDLQEKRDYAIKIYDTNFLFDVMGKTYKLETEVNPEDATRKDLNYFISSSDSIKKTLSINETGEISFLSAYTSPVSLDVIISSTDMSNIKIDVYMLINKYK